MNIAIIGTGYVGLVTGVCFAEFGLHVAAVDKDAERIDRLAKGDLPVHEPRLAEMLRRNLDEDRIHFTTDVARAVQQSLVVFIAVGTPSGEDGSLDLRYVEDAARTIAHNLDGYKVVVIKSTVPPGTGRWVERIIREENGDRSRCFLDMASNPEFLREGAAVEDFLRPNRVVIGADSPQAEAAELIKYAANGFRAMKVSFMNEIANLCEAIGVDVHVVAKAMGLDQRIGPKFLHPGPGFGGSCFPKDTRALVRLARDRGAPMRLAEALLEVNQSQRARMVRKITHALGVGESASLEGVTLGILGLSFKPDTDDVRESSALAIAQELHRRGARVQAYDPAAMEPARAMLPDIVYRPDAYSAAEDADGVVLVTEWNQFRNLDLARMKSLMRRPILLDLRNVYEPAQVKALGFEYQGVGRA